MGTRRMETSSAATPETAATAEDVILRLRGITKRFGAVQALTDVDLDILRGKATVLDGKLQ